MANLTVLTEANFDQEVLKSSQPVLIDFWAPWCGPCRMITPIVEQLAAENAGRIKVAKLNVDESPKLAASYGVNSIPTLMIFNQGQVVESMIGLQPKSRLQNALNQALG